MDTPASERGETDAVDRWMQILATDLRNADALRGLYDQHQGAQAPDRAWCVAAAMTFLLGDAAPRDVRDFHEEYKPRGPAAPRARLDEEAWIKDLFHPDEDPLIGGIFASILPALRRVKVQPVKRFGLTDRERQDPKTSTLTLVRAMGLASAAMNLPTMPLIYVRPQQAGGLAYVPSEPWASISGAGVLQGLTPLELQFVAAKHLSYYRPEHYVRVLFPAVAELTPLLLSAIKIAKSDFGVPAGIEPTVATLSAQLSRNPANLEMLHKLVRRFTDGGGRVNVEKWFQSVELTSCRVGFLMSGDLEAVEKMLGLDPGLPGDPSARERLEDVVRFSISERYFRLREALGLTILGTAPTSTASAAPASQPTPVSAEAMFAALGSEARDEPVSGPQRNSLVSIMVVVGAIVALVAGYLFMR